MSYDKSTVKNIVNESSALQYTKCYYKNVKYFWYLYNQTPQFIDKFSSSFCRDTGNEQSWDFGGNSNLYPEKQLFTFCKNAMQVGNGIIHCGKSCH